MYRVFITGVTGFVSSHLVDYILREHPEVEIFGLKRWRSPMDNIKHVQDRISLVDGDLHDLTSMIMIIEEVNPNWVFHIAAQSYVPISYSMPAETLSTNILGTANLLEAIRLVGIDPRIHICSSPEGYGQPEEKDVPITEKCPLRPLSPYAVSKVGEDRLGFMYYQAYGLRTVMSRAFTHTGPRRGNVFVISAFAKQIARIEKGIQEPVLRVGNLDSIRTFCDVRDTVRAYWLLLEYGEPGEAYNIGGNTTMSVGEALKRLLSLSPIGDSVEVKVDECLLRPADATLQIPDCTKFKELTGWEPEIPFEQTLKDTLDYWREK